MNGPTITMIPTMCVPEKLDKKALIEQVNYLQDAILRQGQQLHDVCHKLHEMNNPANALSGNLYELVDSYEARNQAAIYDHLKMLSERRKEFRSQKAKVH